MMFLGGAQISISHAVTLASDDILDWNEVHTLSDCQYVSSNAESVTKVTNYHVEQLVVLRRSRLARLHWPNAI